MTNSIVVKGQDSMYNMFTSDYISLKRVERKIASKLIRLAEDKEKLKRAEQEHDEWDKALILYDIKYVCGQLQALYDLKDFAE